MKRSTIRVHHFRDGYQEIDGWIVDDIFAVHRGLDWLKTHWTATHMPSGLSLGIYASNRARLVDSVKRFRRCFEDQGLDCATLHEIPHTLKSSRYRRVLAAILEYRVGGEHER